MLYASEDMEKYTKKLEESGKLGEDHMPPIRTLHKAYVELMANINIHCQVLLYIVKLSHSYVSVSEKLLKLVIDFIAVVEKEKPEFIDEKKFQEFRKKYRHLVAIS